MLAEFVADACDGQLCVRGALVWRARISAAESLRPKPSCKNQKNEIFDCVLSEDYFNRCNDAKGVYTFVSS